MSRLPPLVAAIRSRIGETQPGDCLIASEAEYEVLRAYLVEHRGYAGPGPSGGIVYLQREVISATSVPVRDDHP